MSKFEIPLSKTKILLGIGGSALFAALSLFLLTADAPSKRYDPLFIKTVAVVAILLFGTTGMYGIKKLFDKRIGLIIDEAGITDNTNASSVGLIKWSNITAIETAQVQSTRFLLIYTKTPELYLAQSSRLKRKILQGNHKMYGTPLSITASMLQCKFDDLKSMVEAGFRKYGACRDDQAMPLQDHINNTGPR